MKHFIIDASVESKRLDKWLMSAAPSLSMGAAQKFLRLGRVRVNGKTAKPDARVSAGDAVDAYINDTFFDEKPKENRLLSGFHYHVDVMFEDENILILDKKPGLLCHPDENEKVDTLVTHLQAYLYQTGKWDGTGFAPALCNRIDRFTGGLVIAARSRAALDVMSAKIRAREISKYYLCAVSGNIRQDSGALTGYILMDGKRARVLRAPAPGAKSAETRYRVLARGNGATLLECELITGRTHQIRAQFADIGHPLIGDSQYGDIAVNRRFGANYQQLCAWRLEFVFQTDAGALEYLRGKSVSVKRLRDGFFVIKSLLPAPVLS